MALIPIRLYGDPVLREKAEPLKPEDIDDDFRQFVANMSETMYEASGVGLAANQVGDLRRVFIADTDQVEDEGTESRRVKNKARRNLRVFLNPEILESSQEDEPYNEGCLSIPGVEADVYRPPRVKVRYRTLDWEEREEWLNGLLARVFQHERDHLDGVLFVDRLGFAKRATLAGELKRLRKKTRKEMAASAE